MPAFFGHRDGDRVVISGGDAGHLARSLRAKPGQEITVLDPEGFSMKVRLDVVGPERAAGTVISQRPYQPEPAARLTLAVANLPAPALDLVLSRCTEAGAFAFVVFQADRSVGRASRIDRWTSICREASMLAERFHVPEVSIASSFEAALEAAENPIVLQRDEQRLLKDITEPKDVTLFVGPEGGWTDRELGLVETFASLGPRNFRADTAALVGVAIALSGRAG